MLLAGIFSASLAFAYLLIAGVLLCFQSKHKDTRFNRLVLTLGLFIGACAVTQLVAIWTMWHPASALGGALKAFAAIAGVVSLTTAATLAPLLPILSRFGLGRAPQTQTDQSQRQYLSLAEALPQIVWTANADGAVDSYNQRWFDYTGMTLEQTQGWGWEPVLHPDDLAACINAWKSAVAHGTPYEMEYRFKRASDGVYRWFIGRALPIRDDTGAVTKWFGTATDIEDLKVASEAAGRLAEQLRLNERLEQDLRARRSAEAALRSSDERSRQVEEHTPVGLAIVALDGTLLRVNPALCAFTGYSADELSATNRERLTHPEDFGRDRELTQQLLDGSLETFQLEKRYVHRAGHIVWGLLSASLVTNDSGEPLYLIGQILDISGRKAAEHEIESAQQVLLTATDAKSRFLATMSHEIRTPMNGIIGMTELLSLSNLSNEQNEYVKVVKDAGLSLLRVLDDILDYSKIEAGKLEVEAVDFDLARQIISVTALMEAQYKTKGVALTTQIHSAVPPRLNGDPGRVRQILVNLVGNALKFTAAGGSVRILVAAESTDADVIAIRFSVDDNGIGIASEVRHRLFQPFSQVDDSTTRKYGGTGLGLSICKQLVELMHGRIGVVSTLGFGSMFSFVLPFGPTNSSGPFTDPHEREAGDRRAAVRRRSERLLLAEDNDVNTMLAVRQFDRLGFDVTVVVDGMQAVQAVRNQDYDVVFMDCHMPNMDGFEATRTIRSLATARHKRVPIVAMTANVQAEDRQACLAAGMDDYVSKPVILSDLRAVLARWLPGADQSLTASG